MCDSYDRLMCRCAECAPANRVQQVLGDGYAYVMSSFSDERYLEVLELVRLARRPRAPTTDVRVAHRDGKLPIAPPIPYEVGQFHGCSRCGSMNHNLTACRRGASLIAPAEPEPVIELPAPPKRKRGRPPGAGTFVWRGKVRTAHP